LYIFSSYDFNLHPKGVFLLHNMNRSLQEMSDGERIRVEMLKGKLDNLREHWGTGLAPSPNARVLTSDGSDFIYKGHLTRLMNIYGTHEPTGNIQNLQKPLLRPGKSPLSQLYGINGLLRRDPTAHEVETQEKGWDVYTGAARTLSPDIHSLHPTTHYEVQAQLRARSASRERDTSFIGIGGEDDGSMSRGRSAERFERPPRASSADQRRGRRAESPNNSRPVSRASSPIMGQSAPRERGRSKERKEVRSPPSSAVRVAGINPQPQFYTQRERIQMDKNQNHRYRCTDPQATTEELIAQGAYRLEPHQAAVYNAFIEMLTGFDKHDRVLVLEDAYKDCQDACLLDSFGGIDPDLAART